MILRPPHVLILTVVALTLSSTNPGAETSRPAAEGKRSERGGRAFHLVPPDQDAAPRQIRRLTAPLDDVGYTQLLAEISGLEDGAGLFVNQVEAGGASYMPDLTRPEFAGKTFTDGSGTNSGSDAHATGVGLRQYGTGVSLSPGVSNITVYEANHWIIDVLKFGSGAPPLSQIYAVMNHSYIASGLGVSDAQEANRRMDVVANAENATIAVGTNNGASNPLPQLFVHTYNTLSVGRSDGNHAHGLTTVNGSGRIKPEIVAPENSSSNATPMVAAAASLLRHQGQLSGNSNAINNEVVKAVILAGATKDEFPAWSNTDLQPLDLTYGAGELNIYNSYFIMAGGEFDGTPQGVFPPPLVAARGWDYVSSISSSNSRYYRLNTTSSSVASIILTWNAEILDSGGALDYDTMALANLELYLHDSSEWSPGPPIAVSASSVDNVQHLYLPDLAPGEYTIGVAGISGTSDFALAWQVTSDATVDVPTSGRSSAYQLHEARPNPANSNTVIRFDLPQAERVTLTIYDVTGRRVRTLVQDHWSAGSHEVMWGGRDDQGGAVAAGVYLYELRAGAFVQTKRMTLVR